MVKSKDFKSKGVSKVRLNSYTSPLCTEAGPDNSKLAPIALREFDGIITKATIKLKSIEKIIQLRFFMKPPFLLAYRPDIILKITSISDVVIVLELFKSAATKRSPDNVLIPAI